MDTNEQGGFDLRKLRDYLNSFDDDKLQHVHIRAGYSDGVEYGDVEFSLFTNDDGERIFEMIGSADMI